MRGRGEGGGGRAGGGEQGEGEQGGGEQGEGEQGGGEQGERERESGRSLCMYVPIYTYVCWSQVHVETKLIPSHISFMLLHLKCCIYELPIRWGSYALNGC